MTGSDFMRSKIASRKYQMLTRRGWIDEMLKKTRNASIALQDASDHRLAEITQSLHKRRIKTDDVSFDSSSDDYLALAAGATVEAVRRTTGMTLFDQQIKAGIIVSCDAVAEMQTGEGKTLAMAIPTFFRSLDGAGVHVAMPNAYLAVRDRDQLTPAMKCLGIETAAIDDASSDHAEVEDATNGDHATPESPSPYLADVTYAAGHSFGFDYLRDDVQRRTFRGSVPGQHLRRRFDRGSTGPKLRQRGLHASIIDEIDHVLLDDAVSPLVISQSTGQKPRDAELILQADEMAVSLDPENHFINRDGRIELTRSGYQAVYAFPTADGPSLQRPWHEYVLLALRAHHVLKLNIHYVIVADKVRIIDQSTGRIYRDRQWSDGLHQAVETKERLPIQPETRTLASITRQNLYRRYRHLGGATGTASGCHRELADLYGLPVIPIETRLPSKRIQFPMQIAVDGTAKIAAIVHDVREQVEAGRAVLVGSPNIKTNRILASELGALGIQAVSLDGTQDEAEANIVKMAGRERSVTVATNIAGRGTDIKLEPSVAEAGGLHVIVVEPSGSPRIDRQLIGRGARCGDAGSYRVFLAADDAIANELAPWIGRAIKQLILDHEGPNSCEKTIAWILKQTASAQNKQERVEAAKRWRLFESDRRANQIWSARNSSRSTPVACEAIT